MALKSVCVEKLKLGLGLRKWIPILVLGLAIFVSEKAHSNDGWVEVRSLDDAMAPYKQRRGSHGALLGLGLENYRPKNYLSLIDNQSHDDVFAGANIPLTFVEAGYKFNFVLGSLNFLLGYGQGSLASSHSGQERTIFMERTSFRLMYIMDNLMPEPYVAPYLSYAAWKIGLDEGEPGSEIFLSGESDMGSQLTVGALIQLNWIEREVSRRSYLSLGLENTYLDLFLSQMGRTSSAEDPDFSSDFNWGAGLRVEF